MTQIAAKERTDWTIIFLWEFGKKYGLNLRQAFNYMKRYKGIAFIEKNYDFTYFRRFLRASSQRSCLVAYFRLFSALRFAALRLA